MGASRFKEGIAGFQDQKLLAIMNSNGEYSDEVITLVETELERRGGLAHVSASVAALGKYREAEWNGLTGEQIPKAIDTGSGAAIILAILAGAGLGILLVRGNAGTVDIVMQSIVVGVYAMLAFGVSRKSRACAIALLVFLVLILIKGLLFFSAFSLFTILLGYNVIKGISGTVAYHAREEERNFLEDLAQTSALRGN